MKLSARVRRVRDGTCEPIPPSEFIAWRDATGSIIYPTEYGILAAMDDAYCSEMAVELKDYRERENERMKEASKQRGGSQPRHRRR